MQQPPASSDARPGAQRDVAVWDAVVRVLHALLVGGVVAAWMFPSQVDGSAHHGAGYLVAAVLALRLAWGLLCGPRSARLSRCLRAPRQLAAGWRRDRFGRERRFLGHNPLGSLMVLALWVTAVSVCFTGWLYTTDRFWGYGWLASLHHALAWMLVGFATVHVLGVLVTSIRQRENLVRAMVTGRKPRHTAPRVER